MRTLVLGGIRSGKSRFAEEAFTAEVNSTAPESPVRYLAPGLNSETDAAWAQRIAEHRNRRPPHWSTVETDDVAGQLLRTPHAPTIVDDLGAWLTAAMDRQHAWDNGSVAGPVQDILTAVGAFASVLMLVSPEVGLTVVPPTASGRRFADELGTLNQRMAALCDRVVLVVAGQPVPIKANGAVRT